MAGVIAFGKILLDDLSNQRRSPYPGVETCCNGTTINYVRQNCTLLRVQASGAAAAVTFGQALNPMLVPILNPERNRAAMNPQGLGDRPRRLSFHAQENALDPQHHLGNSVLLA